MDSAREQLAGALKILGEKNVNLMKLRRQLDAVPGNAELNQYQRRFTELCTQGLFSITKNRLRTYCYTWGYSEREANGIEWLLPAIQYVGRH